MPPSEWPEDIRKRFDRHPLTPAQRTRLGQGLGRWFRIAADLGTDPAEVTREGWRDRTRDLRPEMRNAVRQALSIVYPGSAAALYESDAGRRPRPDARAQLQHTIRRALARFPAAWRQAAAPLLHVDPDGVGDGILVQAWAPSTIKRRLEAGATFFAFCGDTDLPVDITPVGVRAKLRRDQARVAAGERRIGGVSVDLVALYGLASAVHPDRNWTWLAVARDRIGKLAAARGSRNAGRAVDAAELRAAGQQLLDQADADHAAARNRRDFVKAHTRARTALTMILLSEAPIRIAGCADLELESGLLASLGGLFLDAGSTKEGDIDRRAFSAVLVDALTRYIGVHRKVVAAPGETRLFVGERGAPVKPAQLTACLGRITKHDLRQARDRARDPAFRRELHRGDGAERGRPRQRHPQSPRQQCHADLPAACEPGRRVSSIGRGDGAKRGQSRGADIADPETDETPTSGASPAEGARAPWIRSAGALRSRRRANTAPGHAGPLPVRRGVLHPTNGGSCR